MRPTHLALVVALGLASSCGPGPRQDPAPDADVTPDPDPTPDASVSGPCVAAAQARSYIGCSYWAVDLQNAIEVWGPAAQGGDCAAYGNPDVSLLPATAVCVAGDGTFAGRCDPDGTCAGAGPNHACEARDACGLDAQHAVYAIGVTNADPTTAAELTITDATGVTASVTVPAGETTTMFPQNLGFPDRSVVGPGIAAAAYHLTSTVPVVAYQFNPLDDVGVFSSDASLLLPDHTFDTEYRTMSYPNFVRRPAYDDWRGYITVVAPDDATVQVTPTTGVIDGTGALLAAGETRSFTLRRFDTLQLEAATGDLTGSLITSNAVVGVFAGHTAAVIPDPFPFRGPCCADHIEEQLLPISTLGQTYAIARGRERSTRISDLVRVLATRPSTVVSIPPGLDVYSSCEGVLLGAGQFCDLSIHQDLEIHTNQPVLIGHFMVSGGGLGPQSGDPALAFVPPVEQFRETYTIIVPENYLANDLQLVAPTGGTLFLDGADVSLALQPFASGTWSATRLPVTPGAHDIVCSLGCSVEVAGWNTAVSYMYSGGLDLQIIVE